MQIQFHPASGRGTVRTFSLGAGGQRAAIVLAGILVLLTASPWITVPLVIARQQREGAAKELTRDLETQKRGWEREVTLARSLREKALEEGDLLNRIAFLYALSTELWPRILNPARAVLSPADPNQTAAWLGDRKSVV